MHPLHNAHNCSKAWHGDQVHRIPHKSAKKYVKLWPRFIYGLNNSRVPQLTSATRVLPRRLIVEIAIPNCMQTQRTVQPLIQGHNRWTDWHRSVLYAVTTKAAAVIQPPVAPPFTLSQECTNHCHCCSPVGFRICLSYAIEMCLTAVVHTVPCPLIIHRNPIPSYHRHPLSSLSSNHTYTSLVQ